MDILKKELYMKKAIELAKTAIGHTSPNPLVGCVVVKNGNIIAKACHERYGEYHAERNALTRCKEDTNGAELFVTLEPCCHYGKTPPCTEIIIEKGIKKVYVGSLDSNPLVAGKGVSILREHGIQVETGILEKECIEMNEIFYHYITNDTPFAVVKYAMTLDGKICSCTKDARYVSNETSRKHVHFLRKKYKAILVGINTVEADNPMLNCRLDEDPVNPIRIIMDSHLKIDMKSNIVKTASELPTIIACLPKSLGDKSEELKKAGITIMPISPDKNGHVDIYELMKKLHDMKIDSVLIEGGGEIIASALDAKIVNRVYAYVAPKIIMGCAKSPVAGRGIELMRDAIELKNTKIIDMNGDVLITGVL